jgi:hypothetical protein
MREKSYSWVITMLCDPTYLRYLSGSLTSLWRNPDILATPHGRSERAYCPGSSRVGPSFVKTDEIDPETDSGALIACRIAPDEVSFGRIGKLSQDFGRHNRYQSQLHFRWISPALAWRYRCIRETGHAPQQHTFRHGGIRASYPSERDDRFDLPPLFSHSRHIAR